MFLVRLLLASTFIIIITVCFPTSASGSASKLPDAEVQALREIFKTLGRKHWNFSRDEDPCNINRKGGKNEIENVTCNNCSVDGSGAESYRVVAILLKGQSLPGTLPLDLVKLPCLRELDLTRNYLTGPIPTWGSMQQLESISLGGNRLNDSIPKDLANIKTLKSLVVEFNQLSGNLPRELGTMRSIERLFLSSNNFTGELPHSFENLTTIKDFRINDNQFSGQIPSYIQNWKKLTKLCIQASGLKGPIPNLDLLEKLSDLRISDLNGSHVTFPISIIDVTRWKTLILRNCNLTGQLPNRIPEPALGVEKLLSTLDLSFNRLSGEIPPAFEVLKSVERIYLTGNLLTGPIPDWILGRGKFTDLSYNSFTEPSSNTCQGTEINLFNASSSMGNETNTVSCLRRASLQCQKKNRYKLHINCGGDEITINKSIVFDADTDQGGPSNFFRTQFYYWSFSSTGHFMDDDRPKKNAYILSNVSRFPMNTTNPELYMDARLSPLSLTYYAFCLVSGNYIVRLHFAEIVFTDDETYSSLGRRIFDVYIQGQLVLKDFDIVKEAGGVLKPNIQTFTAVVSGSTLEIRFYWAGKGTTDIPSKGDYGPLISAISMINLDHETPSSISVGAVVGIVIAGVFVIILFVVAILLWKGYLRRRNDFEHVRYN